MKDNIFLIWSGNIDIAHKIKQILETKNYRCTVGGNAENDTRFSTVGDTVIQQLKNCNQAIVIFQKKESGEEAGKVSTNLFFELGYALATYGQTKVHCVKRANDQIYFPSDLDNSFVEPIACDDTDESFVNGIIEYFLRRQKMAIKTNKMMLINNRYIMHDYIQRHFSEQGSKCSDYELAQYILFYTQAAHMFGDEKKVLKEMRDFKNSFHSLFSDELSVAVNLSIAFFEMVTSIRSTSNNEFYIDRSTLRQFRDKYESYIDEIVDDDIGAFDDWAHAFSAEHLAYAYSLYAFCPTLDKEGKLKNLSLSKDWALKTMEHLEKLEHFTPSKDNNDRKGIISLLYTYVFRNLYMSYKELGDRQETVKWLKKTKKECTALKNNFEVGSIDTQLYENFAMEYYLCLIECLEYADELNIDEDDREDYIEEIRAFVEESQTQTEHNRYIEKIKTLLLAIA